jgi:hypothetical protein
MIKNTREKSNIKIIKKSLTKVEISNAVLEDQVQSTLSNFLYPGAEPILT